MSNDQNPKLNRYLKISLGLHLTIFLLAIIGPWIIPSQSTIYTPTVQIDMVALPDQVKETNPEPVDVSLPVKDIPPPSKEKTQEQEDKNVMAKPITEIKNKKAEKDAQNALEKLRKELKKEQQENERKKNELLNKRKEDLKKFEERYRAAIRGNETNSGSSAQGEMKATIHAYAGHITDKIKSNWALPAWLQSQGLRASVLIYIDSRGNLLRYQFSQYSGNDVFDEYVKGAIQRSNPFAPPPEDMAKGLRNSGIEVSFPL